MDAHWVVIGFLVAFALVAWWAKSQGREIQKAIDEAEGAAQRNDIVETSREVSEAAAARRDPGLHDVPDIVPPYSLPGWLRRP